MGPDCLVHDTSLRGLRWRWAVLALLYLVLLWCGYQMLRTVWQATAAGRWMILAAGLLVYELVLLWRGLKDNHRRGESALLPTLGAPNMLTLLRGVVLGFLAGFVLSPLPPGGLSWVPALLYTLAIVLDYLDGYLARVTHHATVLGETLDVEFDALGVLVATCLAVHYRQLPWWYLALGLSRYLFMFGIWWRKRRDKPVYELTPSVGRRMVAGFHMGFLSVMLWPLFYPPVTTLASLVFAMPFTASFVRDWLVVSGGLDPSSEGYLKARHMIATLSTHWLPVLLRAGVAVIMINLLFQALVSASEQGLLSARAAVTLQNLTAVGISLMALVATIMLALGMAARVAALGVLIAASADILARGLHPYNAFLLTSSILLMLLGSGALSCWRPEDGILTQRAGARMEH